VAVTAAFVLVKSAQGPARVGVVERPGHWLVFWPVAALASTGHPARQIHITLMALNAWSMVLCERAWLCLSSVPCVAARATWFVVTFHTFQPKPAGMLVVTEDDLPSGQPLGPQPVSLPIRFRNRWVYPPQDIILCRTYCHAAVLHAARLCQVADIAVSLVYPLPVTVQALLVVSASEGGFVDVCLRR
jgi:hypothetical protein